MLRSILSPCIYAYCTRPCLPLYALMDIEVFYGLVQETGDSSPQSIYVMEDKHCCFCNLRSKALLKRLVGASNGSNYIALIMSSAFVKYELDPLRKLVRLPFRLSFFCRLEG